MRGGRLKGWQRIGIILSVLWVLVGVWVAQQAVYAPVRAGYSKCISLGVAPNICKAGMDAGIARRKKEQLPGAIAVFALSPIAFLWLIIWITRWVRRGLQPARQKASPGATTRDETDGDQRRERTLWKRKRQTEWLTWFRARDYKGNLTEAEKRQLDAFQQLPQHSAAQADQLPEEVQNYIARLETELYDHKQDAAVGRAFFWSALGAALLFANYKGYFGASTAWSWMAAGIAFVVPWLWYWYKWNKNAEEFLHKSVPYIRTDDQIRKEGELRDDFPSPEARSRGVYEA